MNCVGDHQQQQEDQSAAASTTTGKPPIAPMSSSASSSPQKSSPKHLLKTFQDAVKKNNIIHRIQVLQEEKDEVTEQKLTKASEGVKGMRERFRRSRPNSVSDPLDMIPAEDMAAPSVATPAPVMAAAAAAAAAAPVAAQASVAPNSGAASLAPPPMSPLFSPPPHVQPLEQQQELPSDPVIMMDSRPVVTTDVAEEEPFK